MSAPLLSSSSSSFVLRLEVPAGPAVVLADQRAWAATVATVAAWPAGEPTQPLVERRLWWPGNRGNLRHAGSLRCTIISGHYAPRRRAGNWRSFSGRCAQRGRCA